jgi:hypothetical protein
MRDPDEYVADGRPKWRAPVFEELDIVDGTEGAPIDDPYDDHTLS